MPSISQILLSPITLPYNTLRTGIFFLVYPARFITAPSKLERNQKPWETISIGRDHTITRLHQALAADTSNPYHMDIDGCILTQNTSNIYDPTKHYIIHCDGNATCFEDMMENTFYDWCDKDTNVIGFNPPGVRFSPGITRGPEDYIKALKCVIEHLHAKGVPYENITLSGRSLGAAISTMVALDYQRKNYRIKVFNDRSFATLAPTAAAFIKNNIPTRLLRATLGNILYGIVYGSIRLFGLNIKPIEAFTEINTINPGDARCIASDNDKIIPYKYSLYSNLANGIRTKYGSFFSSPHTPGDSHNLPLDFLRTKHSQQYADKYVKNIFDTFSPSYDQTNLKQKSAESNNLIYELIETISSIQKLSINDLDKTSKSKLPQKISSLEYRIEQIESTIADLKSMQLKNKDTKISPNKASTIDLNRVIDVASKVIEICQHKLSYLKKLPQAKKKTMLFNRNQRTTVVPQPLIPRQENSHNLNEVLKNLEELKRLRIRNR